MSSDTSISSPTDESAQDVVELLGYSSMSHDYGFWNMGNIEIMKWVYSLLSCDPMVSKCSDTYMQVLQVLASYFTINLNLRATIYLEQQVNSHESRYGLSSFATKRTYLNLFRFYWAMNKLEDAKSVARNMANRLRTDPNVAPDAFLIWKTLAIDVECRDGDREKAAALYGDLAHQYSLHDGPSNRSYYFLHIGLQLFYTGRSSWREALWKIAAAIEWLGKVPKNLYHATETIVERKIALFVLKAAIFEALEEAMEATLVYKDLMTLCEQHLDEDTYIASWHVAADNRIFALNHSNPRERPTRGDTLTGCATATLSSPVLLGISPDWIQGQGQIGDGKKALQGSNFDLSRSINSVSPTLMAAKPARTAGSTPVSSFNEGFLVLNGPPPQWAPKHTQLVSTGVQVQSPTLSLTPKITAVPTIKKPAHKLNDNKTNTRDAAYSEMNQQLLALARQTKTAESVPIPESGDSSSSDSEDGLLCISRARKMKYPNGPSAAQKLQGAVNAATQTRQQRNTALLMERPAAPAPMCPERKEEWAKFLMRQLEEGQQGGEKPINKSKQEEGLQHNLPLRPKRDDAAHASSSAVKRREVPSFIRVGHAVPSWCGVPGLEPGTWDMLSKTSSNDTTFSDDMDIDSDSESGIDRWEVCSQTT
ncbi:hypothetical protein PG996_006395 [Apiospora saccharicola]|uniref:Uncharacterized protein n=1 Tax=Apiospora saccharicola TaxID=335842 RepID=A0ABR1VPF1_9PEZI